jgi:hypothetical protein
MEEVRKRAEKRNRKGKRTMKEKIKDRQQKRGKHAIKKEGLDELQYTQVGSKSITVGGSQQPRNDLNKTNNGQECV